MGGGGDSLCPGRHAGRGCAHGDHLPAAAEADFFGRHRQAFEPAAFESALGEGFDGVALLVFLLLVGRFLQQRAQRAAADSAELLYSMSPSVARVAGPDGQVWGVPGLFVTDASAFPTASGVNPMLSIMALARRTAHRMAAR